VSRTSSRVSYFTAAADVLKHRKVALRVGFYTATANSVVQREAEVLGHWDTLISTGAKVLPAECGPYIYLDVGLLEEGETQPAR